MPTSLEPALNLAWVLLAAFLVMFMQAGFAMVETGFTRARNAANTMAMNLVIYPVGAIGYWLVGYGLMYGGVAQKDDARAQELVALKSQLSALTAKIADIEGDQPATVLPDDVAAALKSAGPAKPEQPANPVLTDPNRPLAWLGMQTFPELYGQNGENS